MELNLHANAATTPKTRAYIQRSKRPVKDLAAELGGERDDDPPVASTHHDNGSLAYSQASDDQPVADGGGARL
jgi:hypothetical protein